MDEQKRLVILQHERGYIQCTNRTWQHVCGLLNVVTLVYTTCLSPRFKIFVLQVRSGYQTNPLCISIVAICAISQ